jgi:hypothetical protein
VKDDAYGCKICLESTGPKQVRRFLVKAGDPNSFDARDLLSIDAAVAVRESVSAPLEDVCLKAA